MQGMAKRLIDILEDVTEAVHSAYFVDLFVRVSNAAAIAMYNKVSHVTLLHAFSKSIANVSADLMTNV